MQSTTYISRRLYTCDVEKLVNRHRTTIWRWVKAGTFPKPQYINGQRSWSEDVVSIWAKGLESFEEHHSSCKPTSLPCRSTSDTGKEA